MLEPGVVVDAGALELTNEVPGHVAGGSTTGWVLLGKLADAEVGVWEMTPGVGPDTEVDEVFVVLAGRGSVAFVDPELPTIELAPGAVVRLTAGMRTVWTVTETLRKVYLAPTTVE